ncbi:MAG: hypothetical protein ACTSU9_17365 [Promethearchaeota archaeon]
MDWLSPSTESALLIPLDMYVSIPVEVTGELKKKRKQYLGVELESAREYDLLYGGWGRIYSYIKKALQGQYPINYPDSRIKCRSCGHLFRFEKDCYPYTQPLIRYDYGYCYSCIEKGLDGLPILIWEDVIPDMIDDESQIQMEMEWEYEREISLATRCPSEFGRTRREPLKKLIQSLVTSSWNTRNRYGK